MQQLHAVKVRSPVKKIALCMIVKNESHIILRCLESVRPLIDYALIEDTGSADGTNVMIRDWLDRVGLPGEVYEAPWQDFAYNRSHALARLRENEDIDYALMIDADDQLVIDPDFDVVAFKEGLSKDQYDVEMRQDPVRYLMPQICSNRHNFRYRGVLHEFLETPPGDMSVGTAVGFHIISGREGARSKDPRKYRNDAEVLERALRSEEDPFLRSRYIFYLAQSYRDAGESDKALEHYLKRAELGYWNQEVFISLYAAAQIQQQIGLPLEQVTATYLRASDALPSRAEALHGASRLCRENSKFTEGYELACRGLKLDLPAGALFVEPWIYEYGLLDEFAVNAYWTGRYDECLAACERLLREGKIPSDYHDRIEQNARFARERLSSQREQPRARVAAPIAETPTSPRPCWTPSTASGGTELMIHSLHARIPDPLARIQLEVNLFPDNLLDPKPLVIWIHHDIDQAAVQWLQDAEKVRRVAWFVFVSEWQQARFVKQFGLPLERCVILRNATEVYGSNRAWDRDAPLRMAYASVPYRGLSVLLDAWDQLRPVGAELHIWSSIKLYGPGFDDEPYQNLYDRAVSLPGVQYHGLVPNAELRSALRNIHFLTYPSTFAETSCLSVIEAMAAGCRVICPSFGALPETTGTFARLYSFFPDPADHAESFAKVLAEELLDPWGGKPELSAQQQNYARMNFDWSVRIPEWEAFIDLALSRSNA